MCIERYFWSEPSDPCYGLLTSPHIYTSLTSACILHNFQCIRVQLGFLEDTTQIDELIPRLRKAVRAATGGTGKASDINFSSLQAELDAISRENVLKFKTPPFFTVIIRSLTILEGFALSVDPKFRLVRGAYPYVLRQLLSPDGEERTPESLRLLLIRLLTVDGKGMLSVCMCIGCLLHHDFHEHLHF